MAAKFVVAVALFSVCSSSPAILSGVYSRDGRAYSIGQAYNYNGGASVASANVNGNNANAYGSVNGNQLSRDGFVYPGQAIAQAATYDTPANYGGAKAVAQAHNGAYYPVPAPATVITYENFEVPAEVAYEIPADVQAYSSAVRNSAGDSSISSATTNGGNGIAQSSANTGAGGYGSTSSNAKTYGSHGHADSRANSGYGSASTSAKSQGDGSASSSANTNGVVGVVYPVAPAVPVVVPASEIQPAVIEAKTPFYKTYVPVAPAVATSNANVVGSGNAASSAKISHGRTISWRFGTLYDSPAANSAQAQASTYGNGIAKSHANTNGYGAARADSLVNSGYNSAQSIANTQGAGAADARSTVNNYYGSAVSSANTGAYGHAKSAANVNGGYYGGARTTADAQSSQFGSASSSARATPVSTVYRVVDSHAKSSGSGYARANAQTA